MGEGDVIVPACSQVIQDGHNVSDGVIWVVILYLNTKSERKSSSSTTFISSSLQSLKAIAVNSDSGNAGSLFPAKKIVVGLANGGWQPDINAASCPKTKEWPK